MIWMYHKSYTLTDLRIPSPNSSLESDSREGGPCGTDVRLCWHATC